MPAARRTKLDYPTGIGIAGCAAGTLLRYRFGAWRNAPIRVDDERETRDNRRRFLGP
jgi:hypothetical protein